MNDFLRSLLEMLNQVPAPGREGTNKPLPTLQQTDQLLNRADAVMTPMLNQGVSQGMAERRGIRPEARSGPTPQVQVGMPQMPVEVGAPVMPPRALVGAPKIERQVPGLSIQISPEMLAQMSKTKKRK